MEPNRSNLLARSLPLKLNRRTLAVLLGGLLLVVFLTLGIRATPAAAATDCASVVGIPLGECEALLALYNSTDGPNWTDHTTNNWNVTNTPCTDWTGITCSGGHVTNIERSSKGLDGSLPAELENLSSLQSLYLYNNQLSGAIPGELGSLTNLTALDLYGNQLSGAIPAELGQLTSLTSLDLGSNQLSGAIPAELGQLSSLTSLYLDSNQLSGAIPSQLGQLSSLQLLYLDSNQLSGAIPAEFGQLTSLTGLYLHNNQLSGAIPAEFGQLSSLQYLYLDSNQLRGAIPAELANLTSLSDLRLGYNGLTAEDPSLVAFLDSKAPTWADTQTVPPAVGGAAALSHNTIQVDWTPIAYTGDGGYYQVLYSTTPGGPYTPGPTTADKLASNTHVTGLLAETTYYFVVQTYTPAHASNQNAVTSTLSSEVSAATPAGTRFVFLPLIMNGSSTAVVYSSDFENGVDPGWSGADLETAPSGDGGYYQVLYSTTPGGPYTPGSKPPIQLWGRIAGCSARIAAWF